MPLALCVLALPALGGGEGHAQLLQVTEEVATKGSTDLPFGYLQSMVAASDQEVILADGVAHTLVLWRPEDGSVRTVARTGQGPGEVVTPAQLAPRPGGGFAVYDVGGSAVLLFDSDGDEERRVRLPGIVSNPKNLAVDSEGNFWIAGGMMTDPRHLHVFSADGTRSASWGAPSEQLRSGSPRIQFAGGALSIHPEGGMVFSVGAPLRIVRFDDASLQTPQLLVEDEDFLPELVEEEVYRPHESIPGGWIMEWWHDRSTGVFVLEDGRILNVITKQGDFESVWDLYSATGTREARLVVPKAYTPYDWLAPGRMLASYRDPVTDESVAVVLSVSWGSP